MLPEGRESLSAKGFQETLAKHHRRINLLLSPRGRMG